MASRSACRQARRRRGRDQRCVARGARRSGERLEDGRRLGGRSWSSAAGSPVWPPRGTCARGGERLTVTVLEGAPRSRRQAPASPRSRASRWTRAPRPCWPAGPRAGSWPAAVGLGDELVYPGTTRRPSGAGARCGHAQGARHGRPVRPVVALAGRGVLSPGGLARVPLDQILPATLRHAPTCRSPPTSGHGWAARSSTGSSSRCSAASTRAGSRRLSLDATMPASPPPRGPSVAAGAAQEIAGGRAQRRRARYSPRSPGPRHAARRPSPPPRAPRSGPA